MQTNTWKREMWSVLGTNENKRNKTGNDNSTLETEYIPSWQYITRSSPQCWSGHSTTTHARIVLDLLLAVWGFGENCTIVRGITSQPANVSQKVLDWHFWQPPTGWLNYERGGFFTLPPTPIFGVRVDVGSGIGPFNSPLVGFLLAPHWSRWSIFYRFWVI